MIPRLRTVFSIGLLVAAASLVGCSATKDSNQPATKESKQTATKQTQRGEAPTMPQTCAEAKQRLIEGNNRFVAGKHLHPHMTTQWRDRLAKQQKPFATILGCSDSRVPIELLFDQGFGDLFVVRVAGNVVDPDVTGSVEYGVDHLKTKLVVVMGHENCGAVTAALFAMRDKEPDEINALLGRIQPALRPLPKFGVRKVRIAAGVEANVRQSMQQLSQVPDLKRAIERGDVEIVGCVYNLHTGDVHFLDSAARLNSTNNQRSSGSKSSGKVRR